MRVYRIRRHAGSMGGANTYFHADVIAPNWWTALRAAKQGRVWNWRWIDTFDRSETTYCWYEYLYRVHEEKSWPWGPQHAARPRTWREQREHLKKLERRRARLSRRIERAAAAKAA